MAEMNKSLLAVASKLNQPKRKFCSEHIGCQKDVLASVVDTKY